MCLNLNLNDSSHLFLVLQEIVQDTWVDLGEGFVDRCKEGEGSCDIQDFKRASIKRNKL